MKTQTNSQETGTVDITRVIKAPAERIYNAFLDADALMKWIPPGGYTCRVDKMDVRVGGKWHGSFSTLDKKETHGFGGTYLELKPYERIRYTDNFDKQDEGWQSHIEVTVTFKETKEGTEVHVVQTGIPKVIPTSDAMTGWGQSMENLARLVSTG